VLGVVLPQRLLGQLRVQLDLVHGRRLGLLASRSRCSTWKLDTPMLRLAVREHLLEALPRLHEPVQVRQRPVDQIQVDVLQPDSVRLRSRPAIAESYRGPGCSACGDEHLVAGQAGVLDRGADARLVVVALRGVDVPVTGGERLRTASAVSAGGPGTPRTELGIRTPLFNRILGTWSCPRSYPAPAAANRDSPPRTGNPGARAGAARSNVGVLMSATLQATDLAAGHGDRTCSAH